MARAWEDVSLSVYGIHIVRDIWSFSDGAAWRSGAGPPAVAHSRITATDIPCDSHGWVDDPWHPVRNCLAAAPVQG